MLAYYVKAFEVFDSHGYLSELEFIDAMGGLDFIQKQFPNACFRNKRINDPERIIQTPRRIATRMPHFIRWHVISGKCNIGGKLGTALAAAWEADKLKWSELDESIPEKKFRAKYPGSAFLATLRVDKVAPSVRCNTIRSVKELRETLALGLPPALDGLVRWIIKEPGHPSLRDCVDKCGLHLSTK